MVFISKIQTNGHHVDIEFINEIFRKVTAGIYHNCDFFMAPMSIFLLFQHVVSFFATKSSIFVPQGENRLWVIRMNVDLCFLFGTGKNDTATQIHQLFFEFDPVDIISGHKTFSAIAKFIGHFHFKIIHRFGNCGCVYIIFFALLDKMIDSLQEIHKSLSPCIHHTGFF